MLFSIIIPTYNRAHLIENTIRSVLNQNYPFFELIIVDDGSSDNTEIVVKSIEDERIKYYKKENAERGAARNYGVNKSKGNYITFLDSDDLLYPHYFSRALEVLKNNKYPNFFHLAYEMRDENNKLIFTVNNLKSGDVNMLVKGNPLGCIGMFLKKEITCEYKFNENRELSGTEDWELWFRVIARFGVITDNVICACMIHHKDRSVVNTDEKKLIKRKNLSMESIFSDPFVKYKYYSKKNIIDSYCETYISLHLALGGEARSSFNYLLKASMKNIGVLFTKRTLVIIKLILTNSIKRLKSDKFKQKK
jgi:glycosyltransferase involved in cell wall biosynthesis